MSPGGSPKARTETANVSSGRKSRKERRAAKLAERGAPVASGSSTPGPKPTEDSSKNGTKNGKPSNKPISMTFEEGTEFIPFVLSESSDDEGGARRTSDRKGKGKEVEKVDDAPVADSRIREQRDDNRDKSSRRARDPRVRESEREWDRGKDDDRYSERTGRGGKRKYDEYDDGYTNKKQRTDAASRKCPWIYGLDLDHCPNVAEMLHKEVEAFTDWISPSPVEDEMRGLVVTQIRKAVCAVFPDATVNAFGSYQTKLYLPLGDIDLVVISKSMAYNDKSAVMHALANTLKRNDITSHVTIIGKAKVPIVKFISTHGRFKVDISINQENGLASGNIIQGFLKNMLPRSDGKESKALRSLIMVTKAFLSQRSMNEVYTGGLGSYSVVCLVVSFLQMHPKIRRGEIDPDKNLGVLVIEFFELYGNHFNYDEVGISLQDGGRYFSKRQRGWHADYKKNTLSIEDPADPTNDISSGSFMFHKVRTAFSGCYGILTSTAYLRAGILSSRRHGSSYDLRGHYEPEDLSILSTVMGITQETINHRKMVQELYDRGVVHNVVGLKPLPRVSEGNDEREDKRYHLSVFVSKAASKPSREEASRAVARAWDTEVDTRREYDDERDRDRYGDRRRRRDDDEGGRYDIGRQPPKKRRRTGRENDAHAVYVLDDDEDEEDRRYHEGEYSSDVGRRREERRRHRPSRSERSRGYWLAKGNRDLAARIED